MACSRRPRTSTATACHLPARSLLWWPPLHLLPTAGPLLLLFDEWRQERDVPRYCRLVDVEDVRPYIFDNVLPQVSAGNDQRLPQSQLTRSPFCLIPWFFEQSGHVIFQFVKLLRI